MGRNISSFRTLLPPLQSVAERYVVIPPHRDLVVPSEQFKVIFFLQGGVEIDAAGHSGISLGEGDAISISEVCTVRYRATAQNQEFRNHVLVIHLDPPLRKKSSSLTANSPSALLRHELTGQLAGFHHFPAALDRPGCREALRQLRQEAEHGLSASPWIASSACLFLVSSLLQRPGSPATPSSGALDRGAATARHARQFIDQHYGENLSLSHIAWQVRVSGEHLERLFRKHLGITVFECLDRRRIDKAREFLLSSDLPAVQIAKLCGFSSANLFGRHFKARTGMTPLSYRLQHRNSESFSLSIMKPRGENTAGGKNQF